MEPLKRKGSRQKEFRQVNVTVETHEKIKEVCERESTTQVELIRYLVDLAYLGRINFGNSRPQEY